MDPSLASYWELRPFSREHIKAAITKEHCKCWHPTAVPSRAGTTLG